MKEYTIQVGEIFTEEKAKELQEYLALKDNDVHQAEEAGRESVLVDIDMEVWANIEHERWAKWQKYMHSKMTMIEVPDKNKPYMVTDAMILPMKMFESWERQIATPYAELSEAEKESDREQVRPYFADLANRIKKTV